MYFHVNCNVFFKLGKVHLLVSELYIHQNARWNNKKRPSIDSTMIGLVSDGESDMKQLLRLKVVFEAVNWEACRCSRARS